MTKTNTPTQDITIEELQHLREQALKAHRRYLANQSEGSFKLYKRLASVWQKAKDKYDSQLLSKAQKSLF